LVNFLSGSLVASNGKSLVLREPQHKRSLLLGSILLKYSKITTNHEKTTTLKLTKMQPIINALIV